eukprot:maker-scaffold82_size396747-snap-gene-2.29 protein:Tk06827 transcript:maker-scaffold82_size396747-snap-gene-2.29-mRNA-1 annotation:"alternative mitochondrial-like"
MLCLIKLSPSTYTRLLGVRISPTFIRPLSLAGVSCQDHKEGSEPRPNPQDAFEKYKNQATKPLEHFKESSLKPNVSPRIISVQAHEQTDKLIAEAKSKNDQEYLMPHPIWSDNEVDTVQVTHRKPQDMSDKAAYYSVMVLRKSFDLASGYTMGKKLKILDERSILIRCIFLETVAGVPGFAAAMIRHLHSLRRMQRDHGWIHTLLEEAENERMHLMTFMTLRRPGPFFRTMVILTQWGFTAAFSMAYIVSPNFCHRFVGYLEEQAVVTYTHILEEIDEGRLPMWKNLPAPEIAVKYWKLPETAIMRDVILAIRADEAHHREVNHTLGSMELKSDNPFKKGE